MDGSVDEVGFIWFATDLLLGGYNPLVPSAETESPRVPPRRRGGS